MSDFDGSDVAEEVEERLRETNWLAAFVLGAGAFVVGLLLTAILVVGVGESPQGGLQGVVLLVGFAFYAANLVRIDIGDGILVDFFAGVSNTSVPLEVYYAVPMVVLLAAGFLVVDRYATRSVDPIGTAMQVAGIAVGYLAVALLGTFVFVTPTVTGGSASLVVTDVLLFGLAFPLVFATLGAAIATVREVL